MHLCYFDESKHSKENPHFFIGGLLIPDQKALDFEKTLGRLLDTVYFTQSHHSRFLQVADLLVYMAGRYENWDDVPDRWHEQTVKAAWEKIKASGNVHIQRWP